MYELPFKMFTFTVCSFFSSFHSLALFVMLSYLFKYGPALQQSVSNRLARLNQPSTNIENVCAHSIFSTSGINNNNAHTYIYACLHVTTRVVELSGTWTITFFYYWNATYTKAPGQCFSVSEFAVICVFLFSWVFLLYANFSSLLLSLN